MKNGRLQRINYRNYKKTDRRLISRRNEEKHLEGVNKIWVKQERE